MSERDSRERLDEALSALLDGEVDATTEELRERAARSPELHRRLEELRRVDEALRELPGPPVPTDLLARVKAQARADGPGGRAPHARRRWLALAGAAAAAAAAALALYLAPGVGPAPEPMQAPQVARTPDPVAPTAPPRELPPQDRVARVPETPRVESPPEAPGPEPLGDASAEEILLAMELETLEDLEILELLEALEG